MSDENTKNFDPEEVSLSNIRRRAKEVSDTIDAFDVRNLLSEDLERSRAILIGLTALSMSINLTQINKFELFGISATFSDGSKLTASVFIGCLTFLASIYYRINFDTDLVAKRVKSVRLQQSIDAELEYLRRANEILEKAEARAREYPGSLDAQRRIVEINKARRISLQNETILQLNKDEFDRQERRIRRFPPFVVIGCFAFQAAAIIVGS